MQKRGPTPPDDKPWCIGHRAVSVGARPNTVAAIRRAAQTGADMVELDVRVTADGVAVLNHDAVIRSGSRRIRIDGHTHAELQRLLGDEVPDTVAAGLVACRDNGVAAYFDTKARGSVTPLLAAINAAEMKDSVIVASSSMAVLRDVRDADPEITTSILYGRLLADPVELARSCGASYVHPCFDESKFAMPVLRHTLPLIRGAGLGLITWHEERPAVIRLLAGLGVDGMCTDDLGVMNRVLREIGGSENSLAS